MKRTEGGGGVEEADSKAVIWVSDYTNPGSGNKIRDGGDGL